MFICQTISFHLRFFVVFKTNNENENAKKSTRLRMKIQRLRKKMNIRLTRLRFKQISIFCSQHFFIKKKFLSQTNLSELKIIIKLIQNEFVFVAKKSN